MFLSNQFGISPIGDTPFFVEGRHRRLAGVGRGRGRPLPKGKKGVLLLGQPGSFLGEVLDPGQDRLESPADCSRSYPDRLGELPSGQEPIQLRLAQACDFQDLAKSQQPTPWPGVCYRYRLPNHRCFLLSWLFTRGERRRTPRCHPLLTGVFFSGYLFLGLASTVSDLFLLFVVRIGLYAEALQLHWRARLLPTVNVIVGECQIRLDHLVVFLPRRFFPLHANGCSYRNISSLHLIGRCAAGLVVGIVVRRCLELGKRLIEC